MAAIVAAQAMHGQASLGTLYQGRYRSHPVEADGHLLTVVLYIERNPVRAGLVGRAAGWPWSSIGDRLGGDNELLAPLPIPPPADWAACLDIPETGAELAAWQSRRGRPRLESHSGR